MENLLLTPRKNTLLVDECTGETRFEENYFALYISLTELKQFFSFVVVRYVVLPPQPRSIKSPEYKQQIIHSFDDYSKLIRGLKNYVLVFQHRHFFASLLEEV